MCVLNKVRALSLNRQWSAAVLGRSDVQPSAALEGIESLETLDVAAPGDRRAPIFLMHEFSN
jgi:hypothetical protein